MTLTALKGSAATALALIFIAPPDAFAQDIPFDLGTLVLEGERSDRPLEEAPASIIVVTGETADQSANTNLVDALGGIPNVNYDPSAFRLPTIRGIEPTGGAVGGGAITSGAQARVTIIVDGIARPQLASGNVTAAFGLWDTQQIEVARGPQSTLGGRNSLAGNIRIQTNDPVYYFEGAARVFALDQGGTFGTALMLNSPIVQDRLAFRLTAERSEGNGFIHYTNPANAPVADEYEARDFERYRAKLLFTPVAVPGLELTFLAERNETRGAVDNIADVGTFRNSATGSDLVVFFDNTQVTYGAGLKYELSNGVEIEARYSYLENDAGVPARISDVTGFVVGQDTKNHSAEILLRAVDIGILNRGVVGLTYDRDEDLIDGRFTGFGDFNADGEIENTSIYAEADIAVNERLAFIIGGRLERQKEKRSFEFTSQQEIDNDETVFIPKIGLRYDLNEDVTLGYQYTEGFRAGGLAFDFIDPANGFAAFDSETLKQHELYARTSTLGGRLNLNASAFYYRIDNAQISGASVLQNSSTAIGHVPEVEGYGFEVDGSYDFGNGFLLSAGLGLLQTEITDAGTVLPQFQGSETPQAPNVTASLGVQYFAENGFDAYARVRHVGSFLGELGGNTIDGYTTVDVGAGYDFELTNGNSFRIEAFVNNLADERIVTGGFNDKELLGAPRTIGVSGTVRF